MEHSSIESRARFAFLSSLLIALLLLPTHTGTAQDFSSCRIDAQACFAFGGTTKEECLFTVVTNEKCQSWPLSGLLLKRLGKMKKNGEIAPLAHSLSDDRCLEKVDAQLSAALTREPFTRKDSQLITWAIEACRKKMADDVLHP